MFYVINEQNKGACESFVHAVRVENMVEITWRFENINPYIRKLK